MRKTREVKQMQQRFKGGKQLIGGGVIWRKVDTSSQKQYWISPFRRKSHTEWADEYSPVKKKGLANADSWDETGYGKETRQSIWQEQINSKWNDTGSTLKAGQITCSKYFAFLAREMFFLCLGNGEIREEFWVGKWTWFEVRYICFVCWVIQVAPSGRLRINGSVKRMILSPADTEDGMQSPKWLTLRPGCSSYQQGYFLLPWELEAF